MAKQRLDRLLGHMGFGSRRELKGLIKAGRVTVGGAPVTDPGLQVDPAGESVAVNGEPLNYRSHFYVMLHKPQGVITATEDSRHSTVLDLLPPELRHRELFPVGRLDKETEGLLLLTTDGTLAHRLLSPKWHVPKQYYARLDLPLQPEDTAAFAEGVELGDGYRCLPAQLTPLGPAEAMVIVNEGKYHQVRRMFAARGKSVLYLKRLSTGPLDLGSLPVSDARPLTATETEALYRAVALARPLTL